MILVLKHGLIDTEKPPHRKLTRGGLLYNPDGAIGKLIIDIKKA